MTRFDVLGIGWASPGALDVAAWLESDRQPSGDIGTLKPPALDRACLRRASGFARGMASAFHQAATQSGADVSEVATVFGSSLGEAEVMLELLEQIERAPEEVSPMRFAVSVHNAASGLVSISAKNRGFTTSIAADADTPAATLLEAMGASVDLGVPAVVVCGDARIATELLPEEQRFDSAFAALALAPANGSGLATLSIPSLEAPPAPAELPNSLAINPQAGLLALVDAIARRKPGRIRLDAGKGRGYSVELELP